ncbi:MAG TPA: DNA polymerase III subunit alpha [Solirubrobacteraceae bacterium]|jgi:error-prone DNA polymerase
MSGKQSGTPPYVELHSHSAYSFLDGASLPDELAARAQELGYGAFALTDHDSLSGAMEFAVAAREAELCAESSGRLRPIFGAEVTVLAPQGEQRHLTLLVRDRRGWRNLCRLVTHAHAHTRETRVAGQPSVTLEQVRDHAEGLVCLSGCATHGIHEEAPLRSLLDAFGLDALRVELQRPYTRHDRARNRMLERLAQRLGVRTVATGDVHAHTKQRARLQDVFVALRSGLTLDSSEALRRPNHAHVLASPSAMAARFANHPEAVVESVRLAETLSFDLRQDLGYSYPGAESAVAIRELSEICAHKLAIRYPRGHKNHGEAAARLEHELQTIDKLHLAGFFLLHHEIFELAKQVAVQVRGRDSARTLLEPGRGRGSSVSSIVCYLTGLSHIDPVHYRLSMGRFLHEEIKSMPDIDLDFPRDIRERLIPSVHERYGRERSALVAAFPTFRSRGTVRELGKALGLPPGEIERVARCADGWGSKGAVAEAVVAALGRERASSGRWKHLCELAEEARGLPRHLSQHSGGMIVATRPLIDCCPVVPAAMEGRQISQWDKDSCSDAKFLKIDLLGLGMLSAVERCVETIVQRTGEVVDLSRIAFDDKPTFDCIKKAETTGVFQIESRAQMGSLRRTQPSNLDELTIQVAIVRPGPIVGGAVNPYIERRRKKLEDSAYEIPYDHPSLEEPLKETLGTIVFQDQVIEVAQHFAGFTQGRAEGLRRAMSRKRSDEEMGKQHRSFVESAMRTHHDVDEALAEKVWGMVSGFAGFGFPKAHGAAFGLLAYQSTWLRVHHPVDFLCALLNEQPMGFYAPDSLIHEAKLRGVKVLPPEVNASALECSVTRDGAVRIGLGYIKGLSKEAVSTLLQARLADGPFTSLEDLASRAGANRDALQLLAWSGACDLLAGGGPTARRRALWQLGVATPAQRLPGGSQGSVARSQRAGRRGARRGGGLRDGEAEQVQLAFDIELAQAPSLSPLNEWEAMLADYETTSVSAIKHPLELLRRRLAAEGAVCSAQLSQLENGVRIEIAGLVIARQRPGTAKGVTFILLEDEHGTVNLIVPAALYERNRACIRSEPLLLATGKLEHHDEGAGTINVVAHELRALPLQHSVEGATVTDLDERRGHGEAGWQAAGAQSAAGGGDTGTDDFRAVAPAVTSFAQGRR